MRFTENAALDGEAVVLDVPDERTPEVVRALVQDGLDVHEAIVTERTLEEVFFAMTRDREADADIATALDQTDTDRGLVEPGTEILR